MSAVIKSAISCNPVSSRIISIRLSVRPHIITSIQVFAPTVAYEDEEPQGPNTENWSGTIIRKKPLTKPCQHAAHAPTVKNSNMACPNRDSTQLDRFRTGAARFQERGGNYQKTNMKVMRKMKETMVEYIDEQCKTSTKRLLHAATKVSVVADAEDNMTAVATALNRLTNNCRDPLNSDSSDDESPSIRKAEVEKANIFGRLQYSLCTSGRSTSRTFEEKLDSHCERLDLLRRMNYSQQHKTDQTGRGRSEMMMVMKIGGHEMWFLSEVFNTNWVADKGILSRRAGGGREGGIY
ncbi:hypothetical protein DPMN_036270 [Dreissena polymorpha]|uniref:Uncharacterized protein n=1 Tax=Dreissena polymorpha TaxID=45954 RepID=A0A9D4RNQ8_DREPO|nr:hypothetical protein DPMN_036270 [Dreissena polymorpha]